MGELPLSLDSGLISLRIYNGFSQPLGKAHKLKIINSPRSKDRGNATRDLGLCFEKQTKTCSKV